MSSAQSPQPSGGCSRRGALKRIGVTAGTVVTLGAAGDRVAPRYSPVGRAQAVAPLIPIGIAAGGAAVGYLMGEAADTYLGDSRDYSNYTGADALREQILVGTLEMKSADERVMTSISNNVTNSQTVALSKGKAAVVEALNGEQSEAVANDRMSEAIDDYYATIQENLLTHRKSQIEQVWHHHESLRNHEDAGTGGHETDQLDVNGWQSAGGSPTNRAVGTVLRNEDRSDTMTIETREYELYNGDAFEFVRISGDDNHLGVGESIRIRYSYDGETVVYYDEGRYTETLDEIEQQRDEVVSQLSGFVSDVFSHYGAGDIPTEDLVDPVTASTELRQDYGGAVSSGAHAAMMGIPTNSDFSVFLHIMDGEAEDGYWEVWADMFTEHVPTDGDGEEVGFESGKTYLPDQWEEPLYIAYSFTDENGENRSDFTQIESEFSIEVVEDADGNEVDSFQTETRNNQTADVTALEDELSAVREELNDMQEEAQEEEGGGGGIGDWFGGEGQGGIIAGAIMLLLTIFGIGQLSS